MQDAFESAVDQLLVPRLRQEVEAWQPRQDPVPIHQWLHPWLPIVGENKLDVLYPTIRHKLAVALEPWNATDSSALSILRPWSKVFDATGWHQLMSRCIVPKLSIALRSFVVNPANQGATMPLFEA